MRYKPKKRDMSSERGKYIQLLNQPNLFRSGGLFRKSFQWLIWNNFVNLPVRSVKMGRAKMGGAQWSAFDFREVHMVESTVREI